MIRDGNDGYEEQDMNFSAQVKIEQGRQSHSLARKQLTIAAA